MLPRQPDFTRRFSDLEEKVRRLGLRAASADIEWFDLNPYLCPGWVDAYPDDTPGAGPGARYGVLDDLLILSGTVHYDATLISASPNAGATPAHPSMDAYALVAAGSDARNVSSGSKPNLPAAVNNDTHAAAHVQGDIYHSNVVEWALGYTHPLHIGWNVAAAGASILLGAGRSGGGRPVDPLGRIHWGVPDGHNLVLDGACWRIGKATAN